MDKLQTHLAEFEERRPDYATMVLLIDDQTTVAKAVQHLLVEAPDIDLHYISDPMDAISTANAIKPTVILQDLVMPSMEGLDLLKLLRANPATAETPIIMLSSEDNPQIKSRAFAAGANDYLVKLPDKIELIARIRYHSKACLNKILREEAFKSLQESQQKLSESNMALISVNRRLEEAHDKLNIALRETERRARDASKLTELVDVLQSCQTTVEAYEIAQSALPRILSFKSGALCITSPSRNIVEAVSVWGDTLGTEKTFMPVNCWALRRGKTHLVKDPASPMRCAHANGIATHGHICAPLAAQGETLGVLFLECPSEPATYPGEQAEDQLEALSKHATAVAERISLALANLSLREVLRVQSIRDPLTGLFNRRYMEESLERELRRASRNHQSVSVLMLDIDHFKRFNDIFGHQAGDTLLRALGDFISKRTRGQDVACRWGGEEFAIILSACSPDAACKRAKLLCDEVTQLVVQHNGEVLGKIYLSAGVSTFPEHASTSEQLLLSADKALYRAKNEGRNRVVVAGSE
jgi:diguanylate cyclase (GGDEF)-like protein